MERRKELKMARYMSVLYESLFQGLTCGCAFCEAVRRSQSIGVLNRLLKPYEAPRGQNLSPDEIRIPTISKADIWQAKGTRREFWLTYSHKHNWNWLHIIIVLTRLLKAPTAMRLCAVSER